MLLTTKYVDGLPLRRFEKVFARHGVDIPRQTLVRWVIQYCEHFQPLLNLMRDRLLESPYILLNSVTDFIGAPLSECSTSGSCKRCSPITLCCSSAAAFSPLSAS